MEAFLKGVALIGVAAVLVVVVFLVVFAEEVLHLVYGGNYDEFASVLRIVSVASVLFFLSTMLEVALKAMEETKTLFIAYTAAAVFLAVGGASLAAVAGLTGAAWAVVLSSVFGLGVMVIGYWRVTHRRLAGIPVQVRS